MADYDPTRESKRQIEDLLRRAEAKKTALDTLAERRGVNPVLNFISREEARFEGDIRKYKGTVADIARKRRVTELAGPGEIREVESSVAKILDKLGYVVESLSRGVTKISQVTAETLQEYRDAIRQDIYISKPRAVAMALSTATPIFGYFIGKFFETRLFQRITEGIKEKFLNAISFVADKLRSMWGGVTEWFRRRAEERAYRGKIERVKVKAPKLQEGGYVRRTGVALVHEAEVITPVEKIFRYIEEKTGKKDILEKIEAWIKELTYGVIDLEKFIKRERVEQRSFIESFVKNWQEERHFEEKDWRERVVRLLAELKTGLFGMTSAIRIAWQRTLMEHPTLRFLIGLGTVLKVGFLKPIKWLFGVRGGYRAMLPRGVNVLGNIQDTLFLIFTNMMPKLDQIMLSLKQMVESLTGREAEAVKEQTYSLYDKIREFLGTKTKETPVRVLLWKKFIDALELREESLREAGITGFASFLSPFRVLGMLFGRAKGRTVPGVKSGFADAEKKWASFVEALKKIKKRVIFGGIAGAAAGLPIPIPGLSLVTGAAGAAVGAATGFYAEAKKQAPQVTAMAKRFFKWGILGFLAAPLIPFVGPVGGIALLGTIGAVKPYLKRIGELPGAQTLWGKIKEWSIEAKFRFKEQWKRIHDRLVEIKENTAQPWWKKWLAKFGLLAMWVLGKIKTFLLNPAWFFTKLLYKIPRALIEGLLLGGRGIGRGIVLAGRGVGRLLSRMGPWGVTAAISGGLMAAADAREAARRAKEWGVPTWAAMVGGVLGSIGGGLEGLKEGALKGAALGAAAGSIVPGVGTAVGAGIGAIAGAILGYIGGENIAKAVTVVWKQVSRLAEATWKWVKYPIEVAVGAVRELASWISEKWDSIRDTTKTVIDKVTFFAKRSAENLIDSFVTIFKFLHNIGTSIKDWIIEKIVVALPFLRPLMAPYIAAYRVGKAGFEAVREIAKPVAAAGARVVEEVAKPAAAVGARVVEEVKEPFVSYYKRIRGMIIAREGAKIEQLQEPVRRNLEAMAEEFKAMTGRPLTVNSAYRSREEQARLYMEKGPGLAAPPGRSLHERGLAVDVSSIDARKLEELGLLQKYGFARTLPHEPWHLTYQSVGDAITVRDTAGRTFLTMKSLAAMRASEALLGAAGSSEVARALAAGMANLSKQIQHVMTNITNVYNTTMQNMNAGGGRAAYQSPYDSELTIVLSGNVP